MNNAIILNFGLATTLHLQLLAQPTRICLNAQPTQIGNIFRNFNQNFGFQVYYLEKGYYYFIRKFGKKIFVHVSKIEIGISQSQGKCNN